MRTVSSITKIALSPCSQGSIISYCRSVPFQDTGKNLWNGVEDAIGEIRMHETVALLAATVFAAAPFLPVDQLSYLSLNVLTLGVLAYSLVRMHTTANGVYHSVKGKLKVGCCTCEVQNVETRVGQSSYGTGSPSPMPSSIKYSSVEFEDL